MVRSTGEVGEGDARTKRPLFITMTQDGDWTCATASEDGKKITASGRLASGASCNESDRTRDRLFGPVSCAAAR